MIGPFNLLDLILIIIVVLSVMLGIIKGFVREVFSLIFFVIAIILSFLYYKEVGSIFAGSVKNRNIADFIGFIIIFIVILITGSIVTYLLKRIFNIGPLKSVDRILGGVFGLIRGILIGAIIVFGAIMFKVNKNVIKASKFSPCIVEVIEYVLDIESGLEKEKINKLKNSI